MPHDLLRPLRLLQIILLALGFSACGEKEEDPKPKAPASLFTAAELEKGTTADVDKEGLVYSLSAESVFYANGGTQLFLQENDQLGTCMQKKFDELTLSSSDKANVQVSATIDVMTCFNDSMVDKSIQATKAEIKFLYWLGCEDADLKALNGRAVKDLADLTKTSCGASERQHMFNADVALTFGGKQASGDGVTTYDLEFNVRSIIATQGKTGGGCTERVDNGVISVYNGCRSTNKTADYTMKINGQTISMTLDQFTSVDFTDIKYPDSTTVSYFSTGVFDVIFNNWKGTVTYTSPTEAPKFSLNNGTDTVEGKVSLATSNSSFYANASAEEKAQAMVGVVNNALRKIRKP